MNAAQQKQDGIQWCTIHARKALDTLVTWQGETKTLPQWAWELNISKKNLCVRLRKLPLEHAMTPELDTARRAAAVCKTFAQRRTTKRQLIDIWFDKFFTLPVPQ